jgi:hypothetical protein
MTDENNEVVVPEEVHVMENEEPTEAEDAPYGYYSFNDNTMIAKVEELSQAGRLALEAAPEPVKADYARVYMATALTVDAMVMEACFLKMLLIDEMKKPRRYTLRRKGRFADLSKAKEAIAELNTAKGLNLSQAAKDELAKYLRDTAIKVRNETVEDINERKYQTFDFDRVIRLTNAIATAESTRQRIDSGMKDEAFQAKREQEYARMMLILVDVLQNHLDLYWEIARQFNAYVGGQAIPALKDRIEEILRSQGRLGPDEFLPE